MTPGAHSEPSQRKVGSWRLLERIGRGSTGTTWRAVDVDGRIAAVKLLSTPPGDELRALARVCHPAVTGVLDAGGGDHPFIAMELARGLTLARLLHARELDPSQVAALGAVLADALAAVHLAGVTHGDVKPENIVVDSARPSRASIVDFGFSGRMGAGTVLYAEPERLRGDPPSPAGDVYALGLVLWECLHGALPYADRGLEDGLITRAQQAPAPEQGPEWLRELVTRMLDPVPRARPTAAAVADVFASHGLALPSPDAAVLRRRARTVHVEQESLHEATEHWLDSGGALAITGASGAGKTHALDRVHTELRARGVPCVRLAHSSRPWGGAEQILSDPALTGPAMPLPRRDDADARARAIAAALQLRAPDGVAVLVDDLADVDEGTWRTLEALRRDGAATVCVTATSAPRWVDRACALTPLSAEGIRELAHGILGASSSLDDLASSMRAASEGLPGPALDFLLAAVHHGAVAQRAHVWHVDPTRLADVALGAPPSAPMSPDASRIGGFLALHGKAIDTVDLGHLVDLSGEACGGALRELEDLGLVVLREGQAQCASRRAGDALAQSCPDPRGTHRLLLQWLTTTESVPIDQLGWHAAGSGDIGPVMALGAVAIAAAMERDVVDAAHLADALWAVAPVEEIEAARVRALSAAGRIEEAVDLGTSVLARRTPSRTDLPLLEELIRIHADVRQDDDEAMVGIKRAKSILGDEPLPPELLEAEAQAHFRADRIDEAIRVARSVRRPSDDSPETVDLWLRMRGLLAECVHRAGHLEEAVNIVEAIPRSLGAGRLARASLDAVRGRLLWHAGRLSEARAALEQAARKDAGLSTVRRARILNNAGLAAYQTGDRSGALTLWEKALFLFERLDIPMEQVRVQINLCVAYRETGRWERARQAGQWALARASELGSGEYEAMAAGNLGDLSMAREAWEDAERWYARSRELAERDNLGGELIELARRQAQLAVMRKAPDALSLARRAESLATGSPEHLFERCRASALVAVCLARAGQKDAVAAQAALALAPLLEAGASGEVADVRLWLAQAWIEAGEREAALGELPKVILYAEEIGDVLLRMRAERISRRARLPAVERHHAHVRRMVELQERLGQETSLDTALLAVTDVALKMCDADRAMVILRTTQEPVVLAASVRGHQPLGSPSMALVRRAMDSARKIIAADLSERRDLMSTTTAAKVRLRAVMCAPLVHESVLLGVLYIDSLTASEQDLSELDVYARSLAALAASAIARDQQQKSIERSYERARELVHDMRNLLVPVSSITEELLEGGGLDEGTNRTVQYLQTASRDMIDLANHFVRGSEGEEIDFDLRPLAEQIAVIHSGVGRDRGVSVVVAAWGEAWVHGQPTELARALGNLVVNAVRHSPENGRVLVEVEATAEAVTASICDEGPGLSTDDLDRVFERGRKAEGSPGAGLGLAATRRIIEAHGGTVWAENQPGSGAVFRIRLPALSGG